jgi:hypothetical protein
VNLDGVCDGAPLADGKKTETTVRIGLTGVPHSAAQIAAKAAA